MEKTLKKIPLISILIFFLIITTVTTPITTPITSKISLIYGVEVGDVLEWKFTKLEGKYRGDKQSIMLVIWIKFVSTYPNGFQEDKIESHGLYLDETLTLIVDEIPNFSQYNEFPKVFSDFPKAKFITPRDNESRSASPYNNLFPFFVPKEPDISHLYPNCNFNNQGILLKAKLEVNTQSGAFNTCLELVSHECSSEKFLMNWDEIIRITIPVIFLFVWGLIVTYQNKKMKKTKKNTM